MDNKQKIIELLFHFNQRMVDRANFKRIADEIDALYHRDCMGCKHYNFIEPRNCNMVYESKQCKWRYVLCDDYYEEADK